MLSEFIIKAHLANYLIGKELIGDGVLIPEKVYGTNGLRRADLVLVNETLHAFEIKSDYDSLKRLLGQLQEYLINFDKVTLVITEKFMGSIFDSIPDQVELLLVRKEKSKIIFKRMRRGKTATIKDKNILLDYLTVSEITTLFRQRNINFPSRALRRNLIPLALQLPISHIRHSVLEAITNRYKERYSQYLKIRPYTSVEDAFAFLIQSRAIATDYPDNGVPLNAQLVDYSHIFLDGKVPETMPAYVLKRQKH